MAEYHTLSVRAYWFPWKLWRVPRCKKTTLHCLHKKKWVEHLWNGIIKM